MTHYEQIPYSFHIINEGSKRQSRRKKTKVTLNDCVGGEEQITSLQGILSNKYTNYVILKHLGTILGEWPTWRSNSFLCIYFYLLLSTYFEHIVLIIRRDKLYQYNLW